MTAEFDGQGFTHRFCEDLPCGDAVCAEVISLLTQARNLLAEARSPELIAHHSECIGPKVATLARMVRGGGEQSSIESLTRREREIALLVGAGMSNTEICAKLFVSVNTVRFHVANIFHKLAVKNRVELSALLARLN